MRLILHGKRFLILLVRLSLLLLLCSAIQPIFSQQQPTAPTDTSATPSTTLSSEATQWLEEIKTGVATANAKVRSGVIEFSITMSQVTLEPRPPDTDAPYVLQEMGYWHITYRFHGERHFYDIKTRKKAEFNGQKLPDWQASHRQYQIEGKLLHFRERIGEKWKYHPRQKLPSALFKNFFNPYWWIWQTPRAKLTGLLDTYKPIDLQRVHETPRAHYLLTLHRRSRGSNITTEIELDPQKDYHPIRFLTHVQGIQKIPQPTTDGRYTSVRSEKIYRSTRRTYQLAQFEPDIWFPKNVIKEISFTMTDEKQQIDPPTMRKQIMQVHRAVFNIPIDDKDLRFNTDE